MQSIGQGPDPVGPFRSLPKFSDFMVAGGIFNLRCIFHSIAVVWCQLKVSSGTFTKIKIIFTRVIVNLGCLTGSLKKNM